MSKMKVCVIQPYYSLNCADNDHCYSALVHLLDQCDDSMDLIVLPEYSSVPAYQPDKAHYDASIAKYNDDILARSQAAAVRCNAIVFVNAAYVTPEGYRNTTYAIDRKGNIVGHYFKEHPAPSEVRTVAQGGNGIDVTYSYEPREPQIVEIEGIRFGFMTCYDFYFYEYFARLARWNVDVIIGCSHQRTDTHAALEMIHRFLCYHTNAYLVRSSISLGPDSPICGCSTVVTPSGEILVDMKSSIGLGVAEIDPTRKYYKPAGFKGALRSHYDYIEEGRRPWLYRNGGAAIVNFDHQMPYPRLCAHRGFSTLAPENTMPAFGAAISLGAEEIEFDLWPTKDGEIVSCHDHTLERVSTGTGEIYEHTLEELLSYDFGVKFSGKFEGLKIVRFEEILQKYAGHCIMNIHIKDLSFDEEYPRELMEKIVALIRKYDCVKHCYFMLSSDIYLRQFKAYAPDIPICVGHRGDGLEWQIVERAIAVGAEKVQLFKPYFNQETVDKAHAHGIRCNVFYADDIDEAKRYIDMGIDTILTNDFLKISNALRPYIAEKKGN